MIRKMSRLTTPLTASLILALTSIAAQAAPGLQEFPRASLVRSGSGPLLVTAIPTLEGSAPMQIAALDTTLAYGQSALQIEAVPAHGSAGPAAAEADQGGAPSSEALPMLAGLACIAAFVLARRSRY